MAVQRFFIEGQNIFIDTSPKFIFHYCIILIIFCYKNLKISNLNNAEELNNLKKAMCLNHA